jgi:hypothetical protein
LEDINANKRGILAVEQTADRRNDLDAQRRSRAGAHSRWVTTPYIEGTVSVAELPGRAAIAHCAATTTRRGRR